MRKLAGMAPGGRLDGPRAPATARSTGSGRSPLLVSGTPGGIRTHDRRLRRPLLCPLSYGGIGARRLPFSFT